MQIIICVPVFACLTVSVCLTDGWKDGEVAACLSSSVSPFSIKILRTQSYRKRDQETNIRDREKGRSILWKKGDTEDGRDITRQQAIQPPSHPYVPLSLFLSHFPSMRYYILYI